METGTKQTEQTATPMMMTPEEKQAARQAELQARETARLARVDDLLKQRRPKQYEKNKLANRLGDAENRVLTALSHHDVEAAQKFQVELDKLKSEMAGIVAALKVIDDELGSLRGDRFHIKVGSRFG